MSSIGINYKLLREINDDDYVRVSTEHDVAVETSLSDHDTLKEVAQEGTVSEQNFKIKLLVSGLFSVPVGGYELVYPPDTESMWNGHHWSDPYEGGSVVYRVYPTGTDPDDSNLYLAVATEDVA